MKAIVALRVVPPAVLLLAVGGCSGTSPVTAIEIVPFDVNVGVEPVSTTFELEARLWSGPATDRRSITEAQGYQPTWSVSQPWLSVKSHTGFKAVIEALPGAASTAVGFVKATAGGQTTDPGAKISLVPAVVAGGDMLSSEYLPNKAPDAVVINGVEDVVGGPCKLSLSAFVRRSMVGNMVDNCTGNAGWGAAVLAVNHRLLFTPPAWSSADNVVPTGPTQLPPRSLPMALRVMVGSAVLSPAELTALRNDILQQAKDEIRATNSILAESRAGIQLTIYDPRVIAVPDEVQVTGCLEGDDLPALIDAGGVLNVYYVNGVGGYRGLTCGRHPKRMQDVLWVGWDLHSSTTLIHELGHALGLVLPVAGHTDVIYGVDRTNVMTGGENDLDPGGRRRLTVGQVFRMNAESASWLNWAIDPADPSKRFIRETGAPRLACQCGETDPTGSCPRLVDDVARPSTVPGSANRWDCVDQLALWGATGEEDPVALLAGRRWRAAPGGCSTDVPGSVERHWGALYVKFENLTRAGTCPSWVALFFRQHGVMYLELADNAYTWTQIAEEWPIEDELVDRVKVAVHVYYPTKDETKVREDTQDALKTFGAANRSGIELVFDKRPDSACPTATPLALELILCYVKSGKQEAKLVGESRLKVSVPHRNKTTVSHFIGRALGLKVLTPGTPGFSGNIMVSDPLKRLHKLTLGQVFRIYARLNPTIHCDPGPCPSLRADVGP